VVYNTGFNWRDFLGQYSQELLADDNIRASLPPEVIASEWLGFDGASDEDIRQLENRLKIELPPSYRQFLQTTNGWRNSGAFIYQLWSTQQVAWFKVRNRGWIRAYNLWPFKTLPSVPDIDYFVYGKKQDPAVFRTEYLQTALEISDTGDSAIYLLNPKVITPDGEWEAWFFANWLPGAARYRSFRELMQAEREMFLGL